MNALKYISFFKQNVHDLNFSFYYFTFSPARHLFSISGSWPQSFCPEIRKELENFWNLKVNKVADKSAKTTSKDKKFYCLSMFPYPSGNLHMGHVRVYTISDIISRYKRSCGFRVIHPIGWDSFGLPAENAAFERKVHPREWTQKNIKTMKQQLDNLGFAFDWQSELSTCDESYYKWTQFIFIKLFEAGLAYRKTAKVNWDPVDKTVLAEEQIDEKGMAWRSGSKVEKVNLRQWYIKTTAYSEFLYEGLSQVNNDLWGDVVKLQKNWIGRCDGVRFEFKVQFSSPKMSTSSSSLLEDGDGILSFFTRYPHLLFNISHIILSPSHYYSQTFKHEPSTSPSISRLVDIQAKNPLNNQIIPLFVSSDLQLFGEFLDHYIGMPDFREEDKLFAEKNSLIINKVLKKIKKKIFAEKTIKERKENKERKSEHKLDGGNQEIDQWDEFVLTNSGEFSGLSIKEAKIKIINKAKEMKCGGHVTSEKARDWLISRQRFWGTPIPVMYCEKGVELIDLDHLPVKLPLNYQPSVFSSSLSISSLSPLSNNKEWLKVRCKNCTCEKGGKRETDTMDTFVDSSWYFLRYLDVSNNLLPVSRASLEKEMPVDLYIGGKEHAIMHLFYSRFVCQFLHRELNLLKEPEPFLNLLTQGMVLGKTFKKKNEGKYLKSEEVSFGDKKYFEKLTGDEVEVGWEKMSKSKYNGVDPQEIIKVYGRDSTRLCIVSNVAPKSDRPWNEEIFSGVIRWQKKIWSLITKKLNNEMKPYNDKNALKKLEKEIYKIRNLSLLQINFHLDTTFLLNTAVSRLHSFTNFLSKMSDEMVSGSGVFEDALRDLLIIVYPFCPSFASELWAGFAAASHINSHLDWNSPLSTQPWPLVDPEFRLPMIVKINSKEYLEVELPMAYHLTDKLLDKKGAWSLIKSDENMKEFFDLMNYDDEKPGSIIKSKSYLNYGNSKVEFDIILNNEALDKFKKKIKKKKIKFI